MPVTSRKDKDGDGIENSLDKCPEPALKDFAYYEMDPSESNPRRVIFAKPYRSNIDNNHAILLKIEKDYNDKYSVVIFFGDVTFF